MLSRPRTERGIPIVAAAGLIGALLAGCSNPGLYSTDAMPSLSGRATRSLPTQPCRRSILGRRKAPTPTSPATVRRCSRLSSATAPILSHRRSVR